MKKAFHHSATPNPLVFRRGLRRRSLWSLPLLAILLFTALRPGYAREQKKKKPDYGTGLSLEVSAPEETVVQAVEAVINDGIIQGSKEYNKDKFVDKALPAASSSLFAEYKGPGKVFFKVREQVLAPVNFKESNDQGTLAVRYIVEAKGPQKTILRIDSLFAEDFRRVVHPSDGSVESAEYQDIQERVDTLQSEQKQATESERHRQEELAKNALERQAQEQADALVRVQAAATTPEQLVENLRRQAERVVKAPGAPLKSAPFHSATNLKTLTPGSEVVILIVTPYWYGVETEGGEHGWVNHSQLEVLP